ncbi:calcineurin-like phosphoesterase C-terminal domain-containing protein [Thermomonas flagellata]|uniref:calcineurin-like phosphoesterase C-terminal domain-containing protein n=1 Tax=Thermomonas flagellata TaxID=2888524 RepID=UPI001F03F08B|nr:calcineurin-like phosphoesterase C-terminal domain-containing protein [Thermomonas flagellata]
MARIRRWLALALAWLACGSAAAACVPVYVEAGLPLPRVRADAGPGCLAPQRVPAALGQSAQPRILLLADPQPKSAQDMDYLRRDIVAPLQGRHGAALGLVLGDVVDDRPDLYPAVRGVLDGLGLRWLYVPGNHDIDPGAREDAGSLTHFQHELGPDTFAWLAPQASIIGLDDVIAQPGHTPAYTGGLRADQFAFLEHLLPLLPKDRLLVVALHIPLFEEPSRDSFRDADRARLFALLAPFPHVLVLSGHTHTLRRTAHAAESGWSGAAPLPEFNVGAASGAYWSGVKDAAGIPDATMADGTPNGYAVLTVKPGGDYALAWHAARDPDDAQIGLWAPKVLRRGAYPAWGVYANVYMGDADTRVEYRVDGGEWRPMQKVLRPDPRLLAENARDDEAAALRGYDRSPEAEVSPHLWRAALPTTLAAGEHQVEVRAWLPWGGPVSAHTRYRLEEATP